MTDSPDEPAVLSPIEYYSLFRSRIEHEDNLIVRRLSWLVASQSFLFTADAITLNGLASVPSSAAGTINSQEWLLFRLLPLVGILTCGFIYISVLAAVRAIRVLRRTYQSRIGREDAFLLGIMTSNPIRLLGLTVPLLLPLMFVVVWLILWAQCAG